MPKTWKKKKRNRGKTWIVLLIPVIVLSAYFIFEENIQKKTDPQIPEKYLSIYLEAEKIYGVPWYVLAAHHRVETRFSTMKPMSRRPAPKARCNLCRAHLSAGNIRHAAALEKETSRKMKKRTRLS